MLKQLARSFNSFLTSPLPIIKALNLVEPAQKQEPEPVITPYVPLTRQQHARKFASQMMGFDSTREQRLTAARNLKTYKQTQKVSWEALGISDIELNMLNTMLADEPKAPKMSRKTKELSHLLHSRVEAPTEYLSLKRKQREMRDEEIRKLRLLGLTVQEIHEKTGASTAVIRAAVKKFAT